MGMSSSSPNPLADLMKLMDKLAPKPRYFLASEKQFQRMVREGGCQVLHTYQLGPRLFMHSCTGNIKIFISEVFEVDEDKIWECKRDFVKMWLDLGEYDPVTEKFSLVPVME